jgi:hypothetical protein
MSGTKQEPKLDKTPKADDEPAWAKALNQNIQTLSGHMAKTVELLQRAPTQQQQVSTQPQKTFLPDSGDDDFRLPDANTLETLPRMQFLDLIEKKITSSLKKNALGPLTEELKSLRQNLSSANAEKMISRAQSEFKDFDDFIPEMTELAKTRSNLTPMELYHLAKTKASPEKLKEVETKYKMPEVNTKKEFTFGGFMPSNGSDEAASRRMEPREAADDAWDKVVAEMGGAPAFTE